MLQIPSQEVFGAPKGLLRRCLFVQTPTHKVFGRLGIGKYTVRPMYGYVYLKRMLFSGFSDGHVFFVKPGAC